MPVVVSDYSGCKWLPGGDLQTIAPTLWFKRPKISYRRELWETPDEDVIAVDFAEPEPRYEGTPVMVHFHGLEGSSESHYAQALMRKCADEGWRGLVVHYRSCGGVPSRVLKTYTAADGDELDWIFQRIKRLWPSAPIFAMGVSLGANNLLCWAGSRQEDASRYLNAMVAICSPLELEKGAIALKKGLGPLYDLNFIRTMKAKILEKEKLFPKELDWEAVRRVRKVWEFDQHVTAPLHGFRDALDYWAHCSSRQFIGGIKIPTLIINSCNDPFTLTECFPQSKDLPRSVVAEYPQQGGHCGFPTGAFPGSLGYLPNRTLRFCLEGR